MRVLSVDWDYFFPNVAWYDWGHQETEFFIQMSWHLRCGNHNMKTGERAIEAVNPDKKLLTNFWEKRLSNIPNALFIAESHASIYHWLHDFHIDELVNFDQHHDLGYPSAKGYLECGNWAGKMLNEKRIKQYTLVYPPWRNRKKEIEEDTPKRKNVFIEHDHRQIAKSEYDAVFICRSGAWTPSWCDDDFHRFVSFFVGTSIWDDVRISSYNPMTKRSPNRKDALILADDYERNLSNLGLPKRIQEQDQGEKKTKKQRRNSRKK